MSAAHGNFVTASVDATGGSVNLQSPGTNYTVASTNPAQNQAFFPVAGFDFDASSTAGGSNGSPPDTTYGLVYSYSVPYGGYAPNGDLLAHSDSVMGDWLFDYDTLDRLTLAAPADNAPSPYPHTIGCFGYDSFGNRTLASFASSDCLSGQATTSTYNANNQVTHVSQGAPISYSAPSGFSYDYAGNATADGKNSYRYDAEGRICAVAYSQGGPTLYQQYLYDAEGQYGWSGQRRKSMTKEIDSSQP